VRERREDQPPLEANRSSSFSTEGKEEEEEEGKGGFSSSKAKAEPQRLFSKWHSCD